MDKFQIKTLESVNNLKFNLNRLIVRKMIGSDYEEMDRFEPGVFDEDLYTGCILEYDKNNKFKSIEVIKNETELLVINGVDCSDFEVKKILSLADDFEKNESGYFSNSLQISIWIPEEEGEIESIYFGRPGAFQEE